MSFVQAVDKSAVFAWCPMPNRPSAIALGSAAGSVDSTYVTVYWRITFSFASGSKLEIYELDLKDQRSTQMKLLSSVDAPDKFQRVAYSPGKVCTAMWYCE